MSPHFTLLQEQCINPVVESQVRRDLRGLGQVDNGDERVLRLQPEKRL